MPSLDSPRSAGFRSCFSFGFFIILHKKYARMRAIHNLVQNLWAGDIRIDLHWLNPPPSASTDLQVVPVTFVQRGMFTFFVSG